MADVELPPQRRIGKYERLYRERHARDLALAAQPGGHPKGLRFDAAAGDRVIFFIENYCRHWKGEWAGQLIKLEEWQKELIRILFGWKRADGTRRFRRAWIETCRKNAKALALDTPIPTPSGWTTMGELGEGDVVFDELGAPCRVTLATPIMYARPCYRVSFSDGTSIVADAEHLWYTEARRTGLPQTGLGPKSTWEQRHIRTTEQIRATLQRQQGVARVEWNHRIPCAGALQLPDAALAIPPYTLGAWLGNGHAAGARLTCDAKDAPEVRAAIAAEGVALGKVLLDPRSQAVRFSIGVGAEGGTVHQRLRELGVLNAKRIPSAYLRASVRQRFALLQGLMDGDGTISKAGQCSFSTTLPALCDGVVELLRSLGFKPTVDEDRAMFRGKDCGPAFRIQFAAYEGDPVFTLGRKAARLKRRPAAATRARRRQIVGVDPVASVPVRCIQVDSPSHLYLAGAGMVPTHNTTLAAAIGLYLLVADNEPGAEIYTTATAKDQARICLRDMVKMVEASPELGSFVSYARSNGGTLSVKRLGSWATALSADSGTKDGLSPHGDIRDEVHEWTDHELAAKLDTAMGARRQPLTLEITTAGVYDKESVGWQHHSYACDVLEGTIEDDRFFAFITAVDDEDDPLHEPSCWGKANPNLGVSCKLSFLQDMVQEALNSPDEANKVLRMHFGRWTAQVQKWLDLQRWRESDPVFGRAALERRAAREKALEGRECWGGLDMAEKSDLACFSSIFPVPDGVFEFLARFYLPADTVERELKKKGRRHYQEWVQNGWIVTTPGEILDEEFVRQDILALTQRYAYREIGFDPFSARSMASRLLSDGIPMVEVRQGPPSLSEGCKLFAAKILARQVRHGGNPVAAWCVGNAVKREDANANIAPDKKRAKDKIDFVSASVTGLSRYVLGNSTKPKKRSYLESQGVITA